MTYLGIDVGGTKMQTMYLDADGHPVLGARIPTPRDYYTLSQQLAALVRDLPARDRAVSGIGIGVPGTVSAHAITWVPNLSYLDGHDLAGDLRRITGAPVMVANDAQLALLGEIWCGAAAGVSDAVLMSVGTGVGGAILCNGRIVRGTHGSAGAFGWLNLDWHEGPDRDHGYTERHASGSALDTLSYAAGFGGHAYELVAQARTGDVQAMDVVRHVAHLLGIAFASVASILDPEVMILSGGLADAFDLFQQPIRAALAAYGSPSVRQIPIVVSQLGSLAAAYGALRAAMLQQKVWR